MTFGREDLLRVALALRESDTRIELVKQEDKTPGYKVTRRGVLLGVVSSYLAAEVLAGVAP